MLPELRDKLRQLIGARQYNYQKTFRSPTGDAVLRDLATFCRANASTFHEDARLHAVAEGRREVWLRLQSHLQLTPDELWRLTSGED